MSRTAREVRDAALNITIFVWGVIGFVAAMIVTGLLEHAYPWIGTALAWVLAATILLAPPIIALIAHIISKRGEGR